MPVVDPNPTQPPADNLPVPTAPTATLTLGNGKTIIVGGSLIGTIVSVALALNSLHNDAMQKINALDAKVTVLQASLQEMKADGTTQRAEVWAEIKEVRQEIKEVNQSVTSLARTLKVSSVSPRSGNGLPLDFTWAPGDDGEDMVAP